jgi:hypothetical protein
MFPLAFLLSVLPHYNVNSYHNRTAHFTSTSLMPDWHMVGAQ